MLFLFGLILRRFVASEGRDIKSRSHRDECRRSIIRHNLLKGGLLSLVYLYAEGIM